jgi:hypothetical protein
VKGGWRKWCNNELHDLYTSTNITIMTKSRRRGWAEHVSCMIHMRNAYKILVRKLDGKLTGRPRHRCENNFKSKTALKKQGQGLWIVLISLRIGTNSLLF